MFRGDEIWLLLKPTRRERIITNIITTLFLLFLIACAYFVYVGVKATFF